MGIVPVLEAGDLLVTTPESAELEADGTDVDGRRRRRPASPRAFGMSVVGLRRRPRRSTRRASRATCPRSARWSVPDLGRPPRPPRPLDLRRRRSVGPPLPRRGDGLGQRRSRRWPTELTRNLPDGEGRTPGFFRLVLPGLEDEAEFDAGAASTLDRDAPGETLIGAAITDLGERGRVRRALGRRCSGSATRARTWGLVALDQAVRSQPLLGSVEEAFNASLDERRARPRPRALRRPTEPGGTDGGDRPTAPATGTDGGGTDGAGGTDGGSAAHHRRRPRRRRRRPTPPSHRRPADPPRCSTPVVDPVDRSRRRPPRRALGA